MHDDDEIERPKTRADCAGGIRPCPYVACRYHLISDVGEKYTGHRFVERKSCGPFVLADSASRAVEVLESMPHTCALDLADDGPQDLETIAGAMGISRERVRQIEMSAKKSLKMALRKIGGFK